MKIKIHFTILCILFSYTTVLYSQIQKGDFFIDLSSTTRHSNNDRIPSFSSIEVEYLKLFTDRIMTGGKINITKYFASSSSRFRIEPAIRYYLLTKKIAPYFSLKTRFVSANYDDSISNEDYKLIQISPGIGFNYFLNKSTSIETAIDLTIFRKGAYEKNVPLLYFNSGLRIKLDNTIKRKFELQPENIFKKGTISPTIIVSNFFWEFQDEKFRNYSTTFGLSYFLNNRLSIYGLTRFSNDQLFESKVYNLGIGAAYRSKLVSKLYLEFDTKMSLSYHQNNGLSRIIFIPLKTELMYFSNRTRLYVGGIYNYSSRRFLPKDSTFNFTATRHDFYEAYLGSDYFITSNVFLKCLFNLTINSYSDDPLYYRGDLTFGFGFLLNHKSSSKSRRRKKR